MASPNIADVTQKVFALLEPLQSEDRKKVIDANLVLLGEAPSSPATPSLGASTGGQSQSGGGPISTGNATKAQDFFSQKKPENKGEELAVAARYRELNENSDQHSKEELKRVIVAARRNFDANNFMRDIGNARTKGLFNLAGGDKGVFILAYKGQEYVDALPDREKLKTIGTRKTKKKSKKAVASKKA